MRRNGIEIATVAVIVAVFGAVIFVSAGVRAQTSDPTIVPSGAQVDITTTTDTTGEAAPVDSVDPADQVTENNAAISQSINVIRFPGMMHAVTVATDTNTLEEVNRKLDFLTGRVNTLIYQCAQK